MKYRIKKETKPTLATFGKYKAVASHHHTIGHDQIIEECCRLGIFTADIVEPVLIRLSDVINRHLRNGDKVKIKDFGMMKLEIESEKVNAPEDLEDNLDYHLYLLLICLKTGMSQTEAKRRMHERTLMVSLPKIS